MTNDKLEKIGITGGKGGAGKSTVAILFANQLVKKGKKVILCDCDVECPNDYLLLGQKLGKPVEKVYAEFPKLIKKKCKKCSLCAKVCRSHAIFAPLGKYPVFIKDLCSGCGACWQVCPFGAIKPQKKEVGQIYFNPVRKSLISDKEDKVKTQNSKLEVNFYLITGKVNPGLEETGPAVAQTKEFALKFAKKVKADIVLIDTAAGTHCPVINALLDVDSVFCVTEPTPMGAYDLNLILNLCQKLHAYHSLGRGEKMPVKIILNQADLGNKKRVEKIARRYKIKIDKEIPYSKELAKAYSKGQLLNFDLAKPMFP